MIDYNIFGVLLTCYSLLEPPLVDCRIGKLFVVRAEAQVLVEVNFVVIKWENVRARRETEMRFVCSVISRPLAP